MTAPRYPAKSDRSGVVRVGIFGRLGSGNIGNDASLEAVLRYLSVYQPHAIVDALCTRPDRVKGRYGIEAVSLSWRRRLDRPESRIAATARAGLGLGIDAFRIAAWVRRHDVVIVPGMGVLEASLPLRAHEFPYPIFLLCGFSRLFRTKVALVSVGAGEINQPLIRWLFTAAARLAFYRSYRNTGSRDVMRRRGLDTVHDHVYPDLAFSLPSPLTSPGDPQVVCVGLMEFHGNNDDRKRADEIRSSYVGGMKRFVRWLVDSDRKVRLLIGDTNGPDDAVVQEILTDLRESRPGMDSSQAVAQPVTSFEDIMRAIQPAGSVVAIRFHNIIGALKLCKPTIAISYSPKHDALMTDMGVSGFCQPVDPFDCDLLIRRFEELERDAAQLRLALAKRNAENERLLDDQFAELSAVLFPAAEPARRLSRVQRQVSNAPRPSQVGVRRSHEQPGKR